MARNNGAAGRWPRRGIAFLIALGPALLRPVKHRRIADSCLDSYFLSDSPTDSRTRSTCFSLRSPRSHSPLIISYDPFGNRIHHFLFLLQSTSLAKKKKGNVWYKCLKQFTFFVKIISIDHFDKDSKRKESKNSNNTRKSLTKKKGYVWYKLKQASSFFPLKLLSIISIDHRTFPQRFNTCKSPFLLLSKKFTNSLIPPSLSIEDVTKSRCAAFSIGAQSVKVREAERNKKKEKKKTRIRDFYLQPRKCLRRKE